MNKKEVESLIERLGATENPATGFKTTNHSIVIGDVLEKIRRPKGIKEWDWAEKYMRFLRLWEMCGFSKSLQKICEDSGWSCEICEHECGDEGRLKNPNARALLEFINNTTK